MSRAAQQLQQLRLVGVRHVVVGDAEALDVDLVVRVIGGDEGDVGVELAAAVAPQQVDEAMLLLGDQDRHPLRPARVGEAVAHVQPLGDLLLEGAAERAEVALGEVELHAHEELAALGIGRVLVGADDVRARVREEPRDRGDDPVPVGAGDEQAAVHASSEATSTSAWTVGSTSGWRPPDGSST